MSTDDCVAMVGLHHEDKVMHRPDGTCPLPSAVTIEVKAKFRRCL